MKGTQFWYTLLLRALASVKTWFNLLFSRDTSREYQGTPNKKGILKNGMPAPVEHARESSVFQTPSKQQSLLAAPTLPCNLCWGN